MTHTITDMTHIAEQVFSHPSGFRVTSSAGPGSTGSAIATEVEYEEPLPDRLNGLAGRTMGALVALAAVSGAADYDAKHPGDGSTTDHELEDVCINQPVTSTTLASLMLQIDPTSGLYSSQDLHLVLCYLAGCSIRVDRTTPPPPSERTCTRFICFTYFDLTRNESFLGCALQYTLSHPVWALATLQAQT